jgi:periplasmic protein TonB
MRNVLLIVLGFAFAQFVKAQDMPPIYFEKAPQFPGGIENFLKSVQDSMKYPLESLKNKIGGRVIISMTIDTTGLPKNIKILKGINTELDSEAVRIIRSLPLWDPAESDKKKIPVSFMVPVTFDLKTKNN